MTFLDEPACRICGTGLHTGLAYIPAPLLPGDIPAHTQICDVCNTIDGPFPDEPYTPAWVNP